jgi:hypothetical protein
MSKRLVGIGFDLCGSAVLTTTVLSAVNGQYALAVVFFIAAAGLAILA